MTKPNFDILIVGGGMVGTSLAYALRHSGYQIALVEAFSVQLNHQPSYDDRGIALSYGSQRIFETMGLWSAFSPHCTPIHHIHISDRGRFGVTRLSAKEEQVPALGQVINAKLLGTTLNKVILQQDNLTLFCPATVTTIEQHDDYVSIKLADEREITGKLLVAADGNNSAIRRLLNFATASHDYGQTAITAKVTTERPHQNWAFERFTPSGPVALLPNTDNSSSLIWTVKTGDENAILTASDDAFLQQLQLHFGYRLGHFTQVGQRNSYPLLSQTIDNAVQQRVVLLGNAAHRLHPIAGQGFNLGLRDVATLADLLSEHPLDIGDSQQLNRYQQWRQQDQAHTIKSTALLVNLFSNDTPIVATLRGVALSVLDIMPQGKHGLAQRSMGLHGKQPKLARGIKW